MMRLIDADAFCEEMIGVGYDWESVLDMMPTIDAVEVVRCKDCKHRRTEDCPMCNECGRKAYPTADDDFCCYGEREGE